MDDYDAPSLQHRAKQALPGGARSPQDPHIFHKLSLIAFFAWVGLGADGLFSSCYGPEEVFLALQSHFHLGVLIALASVVTGFVICASYFSNRRIVSIQRRFYYQGIPLVLLPIRVQYVTY